MKRQKPLGHKHWKDDLEAHFSRFAKNMERTFTKKEIRKELDECVGDCNSIVLSEDDWDFFIEHCENPQPNEALRELLNKPSVFEDCTSDEVTEEMLKKVFTDRYIYLRFSSYSGEWELSRHVDEFCTEPLGHDVSLYELLRSQIKKMGKKNGR